MCWWARRGGTPCWPHRLHVWLPGASGSPQCECRTCPARAWHDWNRLPQTWQATEDVAGTGSHSLGGRRLLAVKDPRAGTGLGGNVGPNTKARPPPPLSLGGTAPPPAGPALGRLLLFRWSSCGRGRPCFVGLVRFLRCLTPLSPGTPGTVAYSQAERPLDPPPPPQSHVGVSRKVRPGSVPSGKQVLKRGGTTVPHESGTLQRCQGTWQGEN